MLTQRCKMLTQHLTQHFTVYEVQNAPKLLISLMGVHLVFVFY